MSVAFLITTLVVVATPGTGAVYSIATGLARGAKAGVVAAFGCTLGVLPPMIAAITGLAALLNSSAVAFQTVEWVGVAYLLYLAWRTVRDKSALDVDDVAQPPVSALRIITTAVLINFLNPKLTIFFFAFLPQFVPTGTPNGTWLMVGLSAVFMALTFVVRLGPGAVITDDTERGAAAVGVTAPQGLVRTAENRTALLDEVLGTGLRVLVDAARCPSEDLEQLRKVLAPLRGTSCRSFAPISTYWARHDRIEVGTARRTAILI
ncbi:LysE family transporter [Mycolicibacterium sp. CBM1]